MRFRQFGLRTLGPVIPIEVLLRTPSTVSIYFLTLIARWLAGWYLGGRPRRLTPSRAATSTTISVIVPARNEALLLPRLLDSLDHQTRRPHETIVVDDSSADGTAQLARVAGATLIESGPLPAGWTGKTWACARGAAYASGDLLVFLDADTAVSPGFLDALLAEHERCGGLISVQPYHRMERAYERLSACFNIVSGMGIGASSVRRAARLTGAYGPCLALSRADYDACGGHAAVAGEVLDDVALARRIRAEGLPQVVFVGCDLISFRMYPSGPRSLVEGWSKNFASGAGATPFLRLVAIVAWISALIEVGLAVATGVVFSPFGRPPPAMQVVWYGLFVLQLAVMLRRAGNFGATALVFPVAVAAFVVVFARSLFVTIRGEVSWKGRVVPTRIRVGR